MLGGPISNSMKFLMSKSTLSVCLYQSLRNTWTNAWLWEISRWVPHGWCSRRCFPRPLGPPVAEQSCLPPVGPWQWGPHHRCFPRALGPTAGLGQPPLPPAGLQQWGPHHRSFPRVLGLPAGLGPPLPQCGCALRQVSVMCWGVHALWSYQQSARWWIVANNSINL
jgi:hypothetical protein